MSNVLGSGLVSVEQIIYGSFVKMSRLNPITINTFSGTLSSKIYLP